MEEGVGAAGAGRLRKGGSASFRNQAMGVSPDKNEVRRRDRIHRGADITATCTNNKGEGCSIEPSSLRACTDNLTLISTKHCTHSTLSQVLQTSKVYQKNENGGEGEK